jgi:SAM-dependent methyltransferase/uncharacterized protein YbaR (Trm112 family)
MFRLTDLSLLCCPRCRSPLRYRGTHQAGRVGNGVLRCTGCARGYPVKNGLASIYQEDTVAGTDRLLRHVYDGLSAVHDPLVRFSFPWAVGEPEAESRARYLERVGLDRLAQEVGRGAGPARILEIGAGSGSNVPLLRARLPADLPLEIWSVDLSLGMLRLHQERMRFLGDEDARILAADAHALPFHDSMFDRVFHVGAVNGYRDPAIALAEMARVARPSTPIVVVDERLDPTQSHGLLHRLFFKWMTIYDRHPHAPVEHLPAGAVEVRVDQIGRMFYCLTFEKRPLADVTRTASSPSRPAT